MHRRSCRERHELVIRKCLPNPLLDNRLAHRIDLRQQILRRELGLGDRRPRLGLDQLPSLPGSCLCHPKHLRQRLVSLTDRSNAAYRSRGAAPQPGLPAVNHPCPEGRGEGCLPEQGCNGEVNTAVSVRLEWVRKDPKNARRVQSSETHKQNRHWAGPSTSSVCYFPEEEEGREKQGCNLHVWPSRDAEMEDSS